MRLNPVEIDGKEVRLVNISDWAAIREFIRKDRLKALGPHAGAEVYGHTAAQPVSSSEIHEFMLSAEGATILLQRCGEFTAEEAYEIVMDSPEDLTEWYLASGLIGGEDEQPDPTKTSPDSSDSLPQKAGRQTT